MIRFQGISQQIEVLGIDEDATGVQLRFRSPVADGGLDAAEISEGLQVTFDGSVVEDVNLSQQTAQNLSLSIAFDVSGSMQGEPLQVAKESAIGLVEQLPGNTPISLTSFGDEAVLVQEATTNKEIIIEAINALEAGGETALYDGIVTALESQDVNLATGEDAVTLGSSAILVVTDGGDTVSTRSLQDVAGAVSNSSVSVNAVSIDTEESSVSNLESLVGESGSVFQAVNITDLGGILDSLAANLSEEFVITLPDELGTNGLVEVQIEAEDGSFFSFSEDLALTIASTRSAVAPQPDPVVFETEGSGSIFASPLFLWVGAVAVVMAIIGIMVALLVGRDNSAALSAARDFRVNRGDSKIDAFKELKVGAAQKLEDAFVESGSGGGLAVALERASIGLRVGEVLLFSVIAGVVGFILGLFSYGVIGGIFLALVGLMLPRLFVLFKVKQREKKIAAELPDFISVLANTLKAGFSLQQALVATAAEMEDPLAEELQRVLVEARISGKLTKSLRTMAARIASKDMDWVVDAVEINQTVGGDLVEVLESVGKTIRERITLRAQVNALAAEGKMSAGVLFVLPPGLLVTISVVNPGYFDGLWNNPLAWLLVGGELVLLGVGGAWLWKMVKAVSP